MVATASANVEAISVPPMGNMLSNNFVPEEVWVGEDTALSIEVSDSVSCHSGTADRAERPTASAFHSQTAQAGGNMRYNPISIGEQYT